MMVERRCFNSRTPGGVRLYVKVEKLRGAKFQFTHPGRGATYKGGSQERTLNVSIHAPREGCDSFVLLRLCPM